MPSQGLSTCVLHLPPSKINNEIVEEKKYNCEFTWPGFTALSARLLEIFSIPVIVGGGEEAWPIL